MANRKRTNRRFGSITVSLPFGIGQFELERDEVQENAAWELYVELMTRVTIQPLNPDHGLLREALNSLYSMFALTRQILRDAGPRVANHGHESVGAIAIQVLNQGVRPFASKWHSQLLAYENTKPDHIAAYEYEKAWEHSVAMRQELEQLQADLKWYASELAKIAGIRDSDTQGGEK